MWPGPLGAIMNTSMSVRGVIRLKCTLRPCAKASAEPGFMLGREIGVVDVGLQLVRRQHHDDVGPLGAVGRGHHREARALGLLDRGRAGLQRNAHVLHARVAEVHGMGMALAAVTDDQDLLALDQVHVGVTIVIDTHWGHSSWQCLLCHATGLTRQPRPAKASLESHVQAACPLCAFRFVLAPSTAPRSWVGCGDRYSTLPVPGVPATEMPVLRSRLDRQLHAPSRPSGAWATTPGSGPAAAGPAQIHYSTADGTGFRLAGGRSGGSWPASGSVDSSTRRQRPA